MKSVSFDWFRWLGDVGTVFLFHERWNSVSTGHKCSAVVNVHKLSHKAKLGQLGRSANEDRQRPDVETPHWHSYQANLLKIWCQPSNSNDKIPHVNIQSLTLVVIYSASIKSLPILNVFAASKNTFSCSLGDDMTFEYCTKHTFKDYSQVRSHTCTFDLIYLSTGFPRPNVILDIKDLVFYIRQ